MGSLVAWPRFSCISLEWTRWKSVVTLGSKIAWLGDLCTSMVLERRELMVTLLSTDVECTVSWMGLGGRLCGPGWLGWGTRAPFVVVGDLGVAGYGVQGGQDGVGCDCVHHGMVRGAGLGRHLRLYLTANLETVVTRLVISSCCCFRAWWVRTAKCCLMASISCCGVRAISLPAGTMSTSSPSSS